MTSALAEHTSQTGNTVDWSQTEILGTSQNTSRRCLLESWTIQKEPHTLNRELGTLPTTYQQLFQSPSTFIIILTSFNSPPALLLFTHHLIITCHHTHKRHPYNLYSIPLKKTAVSCRKVWCKNYLASELH